MSERSNIKFYGIHDMSSGYYLKETEAVFQNWDNYISGTDIKSSLMLEHGWTTGMTNSMELTMRKVDQFQESWVYFALRYQMIT